jgi:hypothetical protein
LAVSIPLLEHPTVQVGLQKAQHIKIKNCQQQPAEMERTVVHENPSVYLARSGMITDACQHLDWKMPIEIVDLPNENGD